MKFSWDLDQFRRKICPTTSPGWDLCLEEILTQALGSHWMDEGCELLTPKICQNNRKQPWESPGSSQFIYPGSCNSRCQCCSWRIQKDLSNPESFVPKWHLGTALGQRTECLRGQRGVGWVRVELLSPGGASGWGWAVLVTRGVSPCKDQAGGTRSCPSWPHWPHGIIQMLRLEKTFRIKSSLDSPPCSLLNPHGPHPDIFWTLSGMGTPQAPFNAWQHEVMVRNKTKEELEGRLCSRLAGHLLVFDEQLFSFGFYSLSSLFSS